MGIKSKLLNWQTMQLNNAYNARISKNKGGAPFKWLESLSELPDSWWTSAPNDRSAYNYRTRPTVSGVPIDMLLDGGAGVNSTAEEIVVGSINVAHARGMTADHPDFPVAQLERWPEPEFVTGIVKGEEIQILGAVVFRVKMIELGKNTGPTLYVRCKIFKAGRSDWVGIILGARALDCQERCGLGYRPTAGGHAFESLGIVMERTEALPHPGLSDYRKDGAYLCNAEVRPRPLGETGNPATPMYSVLDTCEQLSKVPRLECSVCHQEMDFGPPWVGSGSGVQCLSCHLKGASVAASAADVSALAPPQLSADVAREAVPTGDLLVYDLPETLTLLPEDGVWVPVRRATMRIMERSKDPMDKRTMESLHEVVLSVPNPHGLEAAPGVWKTGDAAGYILITNTTELDVELHTGDSVAAVFQGHVQHRACRSCGFQDSEVLLREESDRAENKWCPLSCENCGSEDTECYAALRQDSAGWASESAAAASVAAPVSVGTQYSYAMQPVMDATNREYSYVWDITKAAPTPYQLYHIEEEPGAIDWRNAVEVPTEYYYDALRQDMAERHPKASPYVLDHILSLEAMLDIAILSGFSFGSGPKANLVAEKGELLGDWVGRQGRWPSGERIQAIRDFPVIYERQQLQQFLGCTNWVRWYMTDRYPKLVKMIGKFLKADVPLPERLGRR